MGGTIPDTFGDHISDQTPSFTSSITVKPRVFHVVRTFINVDVSISSLYRRLSQRTRVQILRRRVSATLPRQLNRRPETARSRCRPSWTILWHLSTLVIGESWTQQCVRGWIIPIAGRNLCQRRPTARVSTIQNRIWCRSRSEFLGKMTWCPKLRRRLA